MKIKENILPLKFKTKIENDAETDAYIVLLVSENSASSEAQPLNVQRSVQTEHDTLQHIQEEGFAY